MRFTLRKLKLKFNFNWYKILLSFEDFSEENDTSHKSKIMTLADLPIGTRAKVKSVSGDNPVSKRLMEMGVVPGVSVRIVKAAPFGDPIEIRVRGYSLAMRRSEAGAIEVTE